jgi:hypothetical protein
MSKLWQRILKAVKTKKYLAVPLDQGNLFESGRAYLRIFVAEMYLEKSFAWFKKWYPAVHVGVQLDFGDQGAVIVSRVAKPPENATVTGVLKGYEVLPLVPFKGGTVEVQAALLGMQGADYLGSAIEVLQDFSSLVAPPLAQALTVAEKVSNGLNTMLDATNGRPLLPYHDTFVGKSQGGQELRAGYLAIVRAEASDVDKTQLAIKDDALVYKNQPFREADYVLLRIDWTEKRDDYWQLRSIKQAYDSFLDVLERDDQEALPGTERAMLSAVRRSPDLAHHDKKIVWAAIQKQMEEDKSAFELGAAAPRLSLDDIISAYGVPMDRAVDMPDLPAV